MNKSLQYKLFEKYPDIFKQRSFSNIDSGMAFGICCQDGWYNLIDKLCKNIAYYLKLHANVPKVQATRVKQKFGGFRFYYVGGDEYIDGMVCLAESMSYSICEVCGSPGEQDKDNLWSRVLCMKHKYWQDRPSKGKKGAVALDYDGVINSYKSGFVAIDNIPDPPVDGAFNFIESLLNEGYKVYINSTRNNDDCGKKAIYNWFLKHGMSKDIADQIELASGKPIAKVYIDDRAWLFDGTWPNIRELEYFTPWHGGGSSSQK